MPSRREAEEELAQLIRKSRSTKERARRPSETPSGQEGELTAVDLHQRVKVGVEVIEKVAIKSSNLKGTFQRALKEAAASIKETVAELSGRSVSHETARLQANNTRFHFKILLLRNELSEIRDELVKIHQGNREPAPSSTAAPLDVESLMRNVMVQVGTMLR